MRKSKPALKAGRFKGTGTSESGHRSTLSRHPTTCWDLEHWQSRMRVSILTVKANQCFSAGVRCESEGYFDLLICSGAATPARPSFAAAARRC